MKRIWRRSSIRYGARVGRAGQASSQRETIAAQRETIALLRVEIERLRVENQRQRYQYLGIIRKLVGWLR